MIFWNGHFLGTKLPDSTLNYRLLLREFQLKDFIHWGSFKMLSVFLQRLLFDKGLNNLYVERIFNPKTKSLY